MAHIVYQNNGNFHYTKDITKAGRVVQPATGSIAALHEQFGPFCKTTLTLNNVPQSVVNGTEYQSTQLFVFPDGRITFLGASSTLRQKTTSAIASTINSGVTGAVSVGTTAASSTALSGANTNVMTTTAFTSSTTINVPGTAVSNGPLISGGEGSGAGLSIQDGTSSAVNLYLNSAYATTTDVDADGTQTFSGTITFVWVFVGDY